MSVFNICQSAYYAILLVLPSFFIKFVIFPILGWGNWGLERWIDMPEFIQLLSGEARIQIQVVEYKAHFLSNFYHMNSLRSIPSLSLCPVKVKIEGTKQFLLSFWWFGLLWSEIIGSSVLMYTFCPSFSYLEHSICSVVWSQLGSAFDPFLMPSLSLPLSVLCRGCSRCFIRSTSVSV